RAVPQVLTFFRLEYRTIQYVAQRVNHQITSSLCMDFFLTNTLINLIIVSMLILRSLSTAEQMILFIVVFVQMLAFAVACTVLLSWSNCLRKSDRLLYQAQLALN